MPPFARLPSAPSARGGDARTGEANRKHPLDGGQQRAPKPVRRQSGSAGESGESVLRVAAEELIAAFAGQNHLDVPAGEFREPITATSDASEMGPSRCQVRGSQSDRKSSGADLHLMVRRPEESD